MNNAYIRNTLISAGLHLALAYSLMATAFCCRARRPPRELAMFVEFQPAPAPAPAPAAAPEEPAQPEDAPVPPPPKPSPARPKPERPAPRTKPRIQTSTNRVRRAVSRPASRPAPTAPDANQIRSLLGAAVASRASGAPSGGSGVYDPYLARVRAILYEAWRQPSLADAHAGLVARARIRVEPGGQIAERRLLASSGNRQMDASVMAALDAVPSLPPLPPGAARDITIDFELDDSLR